MSKFYTFDVKEEAKAIFETWAEQAKNVIIVEGETTAHKVVLTSGAQADMDWSKREGTIDHRVTDSQRLGSHEYEFDNGYKGIFLNWGSLPKLMSETDADVEKAYILYHELGHALVPAGYSPLYGSDPDITLQCEAAADTFAALRCFQVFGDKAADLVAYMSDSRAKDVMTKDNKSHMTSKAVNMLLEDSKTIDFKNLSPQQTINLAQYYAVNHAVKGAEIDQALDNKVRLRYEQNLAYEMRYSNSSTILSVMDKFNFKVGDAVFEPMMKAYAQAMNGSSTAFRSTMEQERANRVETPQQAAAREKRHAEIMKALNEEKAKMLNPVAKFVSKFQNMFGTKKQDAVAAVEAKPPQNKQVKPAAFRM